MSNYLKEKGKIDLEKQDREENNIINPMSFYSPFLKFQIFIQIHILRRRKYSL